MEPLGLSFRVCLGLVFVAAGALKLQDLAGFRRVVRGYRLLSPTLTAPLAVLLPPFEALAGAALLAGVATRWVAIAAEIALVAFGVAIAINLGRGRRVDCGCFGVGSSRTIGWPLLARDAALVVMAAAVAVRPPSALTPGGGASSLPMSGGMAVALATAISLLVLTLLAEARNIARTVRSVERAEAST